MQSLKTFLPALPALASGLGRARSSSAVVLSANQPRAGLHFSSSARNEGKSQRIGRRECFGDYANIELSLRQLCAGQTFGADIDICERLKEMVGEMVGPGDNEILDLSHAMLEVGHLLGGTVARVARHARESGALKQEHDHVWHLEMPHHFTNFRPSLLCSGAPSEVCAEMAFAARRGIAVASLCLLRKPTQEELRLVEELERLWAGGMPESKTAGKATGRIYPLKDWEAALSKIGDVSIDTRGKKALDVLRTQHEMTVLPRSSTPAEKARALEIACTLADSGLLGHFCAVARKPGGAPPQAR
jgi:hypothetical protein